MLQACPTTKGTGTVLYGDLYTLYTTFYVDFNTKH